MELATLKTNNARLTSALQESTANVDEWKRQLQLYKEENSRVKAKYADLECGKMPEGNNEALKLRIEALENELRTRNDEVKALTMATKNKDFVVRDIHFHSSTPQFFHPTIKILNWFKYVFTVSAKGERGTS